MWCEGRNTSFTCSKGWHQLTSRVHSSFRFMLPILLSHCEYLSRLWLLDVHSDSSATNNNISPTLHVDMQRRSDITLVNLGNVTFRSLIACLSLCFQLCLLHEVCSGIRLGTASVHHNRSIASFFWPTLQFDTFCTSSCPTSSGGIRTTWGIS